jgi:4-amino-4-deoxy-L-arabinose transferase-like glycosyltransferase
MNPTDQKQVKTFAVILLLVGFVLFFYKVGDRDLWAPDEDEYAQMSREMIRSGNWAFPTVNGEPWTIKPPLYNWMVSAISLPWKDVDEFRARVFSSLAALGTVWVTFLIGRLAFSAPAGFLGAIVLATNILFLQYGRWAQTNMLSTFFAILAIYFFYRGYRNPQNRTVSYLLMYTAVGVGFLTMGPVNLAVPGLVVFLYLVFMKDLRHIKNLKLGWGIFIFLAIASPWYIVVSLKGEYAYDLLIKTNIDRFISTWAHPRPFYYYLPVILWAMAPWSPYLPGALHLAFSGRSAEDRAALRFLLVWAIGLLLFFSISKGKRPQYILPVLPALSLMIGYLGNRAAMFWQDPYYRKAVIWPSLFLLGVSIILTIGLPVGTRLYFKPMFATAVGISVITALFSLSLWVAWKRGQARRLLFLPAVFMVVFTVYGVHALVPRMEAYKSPRPFCEEIRTRLARGGADWAMYRFYRAAYVYYTDSFAKVIMTENELASFLDQPTQALVAMREQEYRQLGESLLKKTHIVTRQEIGHRSMILISNR